MRRRARPTLGELVVDGVVLAVMLIVTSVRTGQFVPPDPWMLAAIVVIWLPLLARTVRPLLALAATVAAESWYLLFIVHVEPHLDASALMGAYQPVPVATAVAVFTVATRAPRWIGWTCGVGAGAVLFLVSLFAHGPDLLAADVTLFNVVLIAAGIGVAVGSWRDRLVAEAHARDEETRSAVVEERMRIARELHDVLAHNLTLVNAKAAVADYLVTTDPKAASEALQDITQHTRRAIDDLGATIGLLRGGDDEAGVLDDGFKPMPGMSDLDELLDSFRSAGVQVDFTESGARHELSRHGDLAAYRIVQEGLTNATKHAGGAPVAVKFEWSSERLALHISNQIVTRPVGARPAAGTGNGVIGMRERAVAAGGGLDAAPQDGRFRVDGWLPVNVEPATPHADPDADTTTRGSSDGGERE